MATKRGKKPTKKVKSLPAKKLTSAQEKDVKAGFIWFAKGGKKPSSS
jgi:hypothetical protein